MRTFKVSKESILTLKEKIKAINTYDIQDLRNIIQDFEKDPKRYEKDVIIAVINKLFDLGVTSI